jgi:hypothetical protein
MRTRPDHRRWTIQLPRIVTARSRSVKQRVLIGGGHRGWHACHKQESGADGSKADGLRC